MTFGAYKGTACIATPPHLQSERILLSFYFVECKQMLSRETNPVSRSITLWNINN